jgi:hypothetical protein
MAKGAMTSRLLDETTSAVGMTSPGLDDGDQFQGPTQVVTDPDTIVDGLTIRQWSEDWLDALINTRAGNINGINDPNGKIAEEINGSHSPMYFITGAPTGAVRTFEVHLGQNVLLPIANETDSEGPQISSSLPQFSFGGPGEPTFADEVQQVLNSVQFSNVTLALDGMPITGLQETQTGIFSAGIARPGSEAPDLFGAAPGALLSTTGQEGYYAVFEGLSKGTHVITSSATFTVNPPLGTSSQFMQHTDIIKVD